MEDKERTSAFSNQTKEPHPRQAANFFSNMFFCWVFPLFAKGYKKDLTEADLYCLLKEHQSKVLGDKLEKAWNEEKNLHKNPSLVRPLFKVFGKETAIYGVILLISEILIKMAQPYLLGHLLDFYTPNQTVVSKNDAYMYASLLILSLILNVIVNHHNFLCLLLLGTKARIACCSLIYRKALRLSKNSMAEATVGQIVNLLSNDVSRFGHLMIFIHNVWIAPLETIVIIYLMYVMVDPYALTGVGILLIFIPFQLYVGKKLANYRMKTAKRTDERVLLMNEIISGIQAIKMYTWEKPFAKLVDQARKFEIRQIRKSGYMHGISYATMFYMNRVALFIFVATFVLTGHQLDARYLYMVTLFYDTLSGALVHSLPYSVSILAETKVSVERINKFLLREEITLDQVSKKVAENGSSSKQRRVENIGIHVKEASLEFSQNLGLKDVNFDVDPKQLVAIIGRVGCGKSTLLNVIMKELPLTLGNLEVNGKLSYASQEPWLFSGSIKQNILFGEEMEAERYQEVIKICALERDFSLFPHGDRTIVGEKGVMLSGGQKARVNLARAIYKKADIYLLDDPLSAVDTEVGKQIFDECISGYLREKCTVLVTHQLQFLKNVNKIYFIENGTVAATGNYQEIQASRPDFLSILQEETEIEKEKDVIDEDNAKKANGSEKVELPSEVQEQRSSGTVDKSVYASYLKAGSSWVFFSLLVSLFLFTQLGGSGTDYFLAFWVNLGQKEIKNNGTITNATNWMSLFFTSNNCIYIYSSLLAFTIFMANSSIFCFVILSMRASRNLHNRMFSKIVYATMRFFNTNPSGRILNRFSKDIGAIDETLPSVLIDTIEIGLFSASVTIVISVVNPWLLIPTIVLFTLFYFYRTIFIATSRDLKRMDGTTRSPVLTHLTASLQGITTIRAFKAQKILMLEFDRHQDLNTSAVYSFLSTNRSFGFWLDFNCSIYVALVILSFLLMGSEALGGNVGLAITQSLNLTGMLQWGIRQWSEMENQMTSVERVMEYTKITPEPDGGNKTPPKIWPSEGRVEFREVSMRYSPTEPLVLKNLSFTIKPKEKVGIVGRTGAGKSSIISTLFRLVELEGKILIDEIDTKDISLNDLRSKIAIIPQEPVLFSGTLRKNLDPFEEYDDDVLWKALENVELKTYISELESGLQSQITEGGSNFSVGQRQLLCLARAIIRNNKILVLDEATANVDPQTDELIQATIRTKFEECTVLTIAHRLHTVMDSDKILVMDAGSALEFGHPHLLLQQVNGTFYGLVSQTGKTMANNLMGKARESFLKQQK